MIDNLKTEVNVAREGNKFKINFLREDLADADAIEANIKQIEASIEETQKQLDSIDKQVETQKASWKKLIEQNTKLLESFKPFRTEALALIKEEELKNARRSPEAQAEIAEQKAIEAAVQENAQTL